MVKYNYLGLVFKCNAKLNVAKSHLCQKGLRATVYVFFFNKSQKSSSPTGYKVLYGTELTYVAAKAVTYLKDSSLDFQNMYYL